MQNEAIYLGNLLVYLKGIPDQALYAASKAAFMGMVRCFAWDFEKRNITANYIAPGGVKTDIYPEAAARYISGGNKLSEAEIDERVGRMSPFGRPSFPSDIAGIAARLPIPEVQWLTGQTVHASGGVHMG